MAAQVFYLIGFLLIVLLLAVLGYYGWRLATVRKATDDSERRLQAFVQQQTQSLSSGPAAASGAGTPPPTKPVDLPSSDTAEESGGWGAPGAAAAGVSRVYDRRLDLSGISPEPVYVRRSKSGDVDVQIGGKPPMPLKYVLDPKARSTLQAVAMQVTVDLGPSWAVLASDDPEGRLTVTRVG